MRGVHGRRLQKRLAMSYSGLILACGVILLAIPNALLITVQSTHRVGGRPRSPAIVLANSQHGADVQQLVVGSAVALALLVPLSLVLGWLVAGRMLRPLRQITATAQDISAGDLHRRLALGDPDDELKELGRTLDDLFARLEAAFESQRRFVANASHELRTPLAGQRTLIQVALADPHARAETLRSTCEEALTLGDQQERLIEALLTLATSERGIERWEHFDLAGVASTVLGTRREEASCRGVSIEAALSTVPVTGDPRLVESLVANLVDNGLRYNREGGRVTVATAATAGRSRIRVTNTGPVIPVDQVERLFQPFQRLSTDRARHPRGGHGLGLAIVHAIAVAHGAVLSARAQPEGGLDIDVAFAADGEAEPPQAASTASALNSIGPRITSRRRGRPE